jgi:hypothetical protein
MHDMQAYHMQLTIFAAYYVPVGHDGRNAVVRSYEDERA